MSIRDEKEYGKLPKWFTFSDLFWLLFGLGVVFLLGGITGALIAHFFWK